MSPRNTGRGSRIGGPGGPPFYTLKAHGGAFGKRPPSAYLAAATRDAANTALEALAWVVVAAMNSPARVWIENHIIDRGAWTSRRIGGDE